MFLQIYFHLDGSFTALYCDKNGRCGPTRFALALDERTTVLIREKMKGNMRDTGNDPISWTLPYPWIIFAQVNFAK